MGTSIHKILVSLGAGIFTIIMILAVLMLMVLIISVTFFLPILLLILAFKGYVVAGICLIVLMIGQVIIGIIREVKNDKTRK